MLPRISFFGIGVLVLLGLGAGSHPTPRKKISDVAVAAWAAASPARINKVVCFGDSLSDDGTGAWLFTNKTWPAHPGYVGHRFTNGPIYTEYLAQDLMVPLESSAVGGASISNRVSSASGPNSSWPVDCILDQIRKYSDGKTDEKNTVFVVYAGANDAFFGMEEGGTPSQVVEDLTEAVGMLKAIGGRYILIPTLPPLGESYPFANALPKAAKKMGEFSTELRLQFFDWAHTESSVAIVDFYKLYEKLMGSPVRYGFNPAKLKLGCIEKGACRNPEEHIWFDNFHPTTSVHKMLSEVALVALQGLTGKLRFEREK